MLGCKLVDTPIDPNSKLGGHPIDSLVDKGRYQHLVEKLIYLSALGLILHSQLVLLVHAHSLRGTHESCL